MSKWIKVEDGLPNEKQMITVYGKPKGSECARVWSGVVFSNNRFWDFDVVYSSKIGNIADFIEMDGVTHWMPLPEPPNT